MGDSHRYDHTLKRFMNAMQKQGRTSKASSASSHRIRLPGFISEKEIGLGDIIKRATSAIGIKPCGGCERRAAALNQWVIFTGGHRR
jgi:hypothetical protein